MGLDNYEWLDDSPQLATGREESHEQYQEKARKAQIQLKKIQKDEKSAQNDNQKLFRTTLDDNYAYVCKNGEINWYELQSHDEDDPWQLDEVDGVSLFDTDNPRLIRINGNLF